MRFPVTQAHPTKIMFTVIALHVIAASIFFNAYMTSRALEIGKKINVDK